LPTYTGNLVSLTGNVTTTANVSGNYLLGNITQATGYYVYGNSNVANYLPTYTGNLVSVSLIEVTQGSLPQIGTIISANGIFAGTGTPLTEDNSAANILTGGNINAGHYFGNGYYLTGLPAQYSNANVANYLASNANIDITIGVGNITTQGNITTTGSATIQGALYLSTVRVINDYTVGNGDYAILVNGSANVNITLPSDDINGRTLDIKDISGTLSSAKVINIIGGNIDGNSSFQLNEPYNSATLIYNTSRWWII
jgi:hypothetical protein